MILLLTLLLKTYRNTWFSIIVLIIAIATGAIGLSTVLNLNERASQVQNVRPWYDYTQFNHISALTAKKLTIEDYRNAKASIDAPLIALAEKTISLEKVSANEEKLQLQMIGVDSLSAISALPFFEDNQRTQVRELSSSRLFGNVVYMNSATLDMLEMSTNSFLSEMKTHNDIVVGDDLPNNLILADLSTFVRMEFGMNDSAQTINKSDTFSFDQTQTVTTNALPSVDISDLLLSAIIIPGDIPTEVTANIRNALPTHLVLNAPDNRFAATQMSESFQLNLLALGLLMFAVCMFIVLNAGNLLLHKRMPMLLTLRQLGFSRNTIIGVLFIELSFIALVVSALASIISQTIDNNLAQQLTPIIGQNELKTPLYVRFLQLAIVCVASSILAFVPSLKKLKTDLMGLTSESNAINRNALLIGSLLICMISVIALFLASGLSILLTSTATFILSICGLLLVLLPLVINRLKNALASSGVIVLLSSSAADSLTSRTSLAFCAFFIAVTCNIGMNLMVDSFEQATQRWLDQRLIADAYIYSSNELQSDSFSNQEGHTITVIPRLEDKQTYEGKPIDIFSYPNTKQYRDALAFQEASRDAWSLYENSIGIFVNQQFANMHKKSIGNVVSLISPANKTISDYKIVGIFYDYGNPYGQVLMPLTAFDNNSTRQVYALHAQPKLTQSKIDSLAKEKELQIFSAEKLVALSMRAFNDTFLITNVLNLVTLLVAAIALACTILVLMEDTRRQQFLLKSLGFSSVQIAKISLNQYLLLIIVGLALATPFGICVSWILINVINLNAFQWQYPLIVEPMVLIKIYALSVIIILLSIAIPIFTKSNRPISAELACID